MNVTETVKSFLKKYGLENKRLIVGFSGGCDSLCLLDVVNKLGLSPVAVHLNHNWRGEESERDERFCREFCLANGIEFYSEKLSSGIPHTETAARTARYDFFEKYASKVNAQAVLTAHNLDDTAETLIYRIIKGTGINGLKGINEKRDNFYRPLLNVSRDEIETYCSEENLKGVEDSSNKDTKYKRNLIRHKLIPLINEINQNYKQSLKNLSESADETTHIVQEYISHIKEEAGNSTKEFSKFGKPAQNYLIYDFFLRNNLDYDRKKITAIVDFINENARSKSGKKTSITKDLWIFVNCQKFEFINQHKKLTCEININKEGDYEFGDYIFSIKKTTGTVCKFPQDKNLEAYAELDVLNFTLRYRQEGDVIYPLGSTGSQKLKKYFNEKKIPNHEKDSKVLLCRGNEVFWAAGLGISDKIKVVNKATHVLKLFKKKG